MVLYSLALGSFPLFKILAIPYAANITKIGSIGLLILSSPQNIEVMMMKNSTNKYKIKLVVNFFNEIIEPYIANINTKKYCKEKRVKRLKCQNSLNL